MKKLTVLLIFFLLAACLPAPQTQVSADPTVTLTPTVVSTLTLTPNPTATILPQATALKEELREFVPAETIDFSENLSEYDLKLSPDADLKAIYWDIAVVQLGNATSKSAGMEKNRKIYEEIIKDFSQWGGIGSGSDYKERVAFMKEFLTRTGGTMIVQSHNFEKFEVDFNQPIKFEVVEVRTLSPKVFFPIGLGLPGNLLGRGGGGYMAKNENSQLYYKLEIVPEGLQEALSNKNYFYASHNWEAGEVVSNLFRFVIASTAYKNGESGQHSYRLYTQGELPSSDNFYGSVNWTFIK
jgi:hypothetical protein